MTLGGTFLRNFYTQLNFESPTTAPAKLASAELGLKASNSSSTLGTVTIALSSYAAPGVSIVKYEPPKPKIQGMIWFWFWLIIILINVAIFVAILAGVRWLCQYAVVYLSNRYGGRNPTEKQVENEKISNYQEIRSSSSSDRVGSF